MDEGAIIQQFGLWFVVRDGVLREFEPPAYLRIPYYAETAPGWEPIRWDGANHMKIEKRPAPDLMDAVREIAQGTRRGQGFMAQESNPLAFKVGMRVQLNSDGPMMTVEAVEGDFVTCVWFDKASLRRERFLADMIKGTEA